MRKKYEIPNNEAWFWFDFWISSVFWNSDTNFYNMDMDMKFSELEENTLYMVEFLGNFKAVFAVKQDNFVCVFNPVCDSNHKLLHTLIESGITPFEALSMLEL